MFAYEEAIGYCCGSVVKDKDGISAAAILAEMVIQLREEGKTLSSHLSDLKERYGYFVGKNSYVKFLDESVLQEIFDKVRNDKNYITEIGGVRVMGARDLTLGYDSSSEDGKSKLPSDPTSQFVTFTLENQAVVSLRTSGTEPKLKYYIEAVGESEEEGKEMCERLAKAVLVDLIGVEKRGDKLEMPAA